MPKAHIFFWILLSFVAGVGARSLASIPYEAVLGFLVSGSAVVVFGWIKGDSLGGRANRIVVLGFCILVFAAGIFRYISVLPERSIALSNFSDTGEQVVIEGVVIEEPEKRKDDIRFVLETDAIFFSNGRQKEISERILITAERYPEYSYGDVLRVSGRITKPEAFNGFDYPSYLASHRIFSLVRYPEIERVGIGEGAFLRSLLFGIKRSLEENVREIFPEPHAALLNGIILGDRASIPDELLESFNRTGTTHILALSGFNITIIADSLLRVFGFLALGPVIGFWFAVAGISLFTIMVGASASVVRAAIMGVLVLLARKEGRAYSITNALLFAGFLMILQNPLIVRFDRGFQLSFLATCGLMYAAPRIEKALKGFALPGYIRENLVMTLSAELMVFPAILYYFGSVSMLSPLANILVLPVIPFAMFFGFLAAMAAFVSSALGVLVSSIANLLLSYQIGVIHFFSALPYAQISFGSAAPVMAAILFAGVLFWLVSGRFSSDKTSKSSLVV